MLWDVCLFAFFSFYFFSSANGFPLKFYLRRFLLLLLLFFSLIFSSPTCVGVGWGGGVVKPTLDWRVTMFDIHVQSLRSETMQVYLKEDCVLDGEGSMIFASSSSSMDGCVYDRLQWLIDFHKPLSPPCNYRCHAGLKNVQRDHWRGKNFWETEWSTHGLSRARKYWNYRSAPQVGRIVFIFMQNGPPTTSWTASMLLVRLHVKTQCSGAVWKWRWPSWAPRP